MQPPNAWNKAAVSASRLARGLPGSLCVVTAGASMVCMTFVQFGILKVPLIGVAFSVGSVIFTLGSTLIAEIAPPSQRGTLLGVSNFFHTLAGLGLLAAILIRPEADLRSDQRHDSSTR